ncbi:MAG: hypothetical protein RRA15_13360 [bacterium]|nr:hypothetical protein [bacterium]MDT8367448.1 hypothetical protein [bacterium]
MDKKASELIEKFLNPILETEASLLPGKKQRALHEMSLILKHDGKEAERVGDKDRIKTVRDHLSLLEIPANEDERPDLDAVAEAWLDLIRETWYEKLTQRRRFKPLRLKNIRKDLRNKPIFSERIVDAFEKIPTAQPIHTKVFSAIVGVPD